MKRRSCCHNVKPVLHDARLFQKELNFACFRQRKSTVQGVAGIHLLMESVDFRFPVVLPSPDTLARAG
eukprot:6040513-Heterocapsa_arctica.AAC.1